MIINDKVYGRNEITEPVLLELLKSPSVLRLKNISQYGLPDQYYPLKNFSRYEHCVGVMILLRKLGASVEEQIAGLLHDVPHLAFSHVADWVFGEGKKGIENYHDLISEAFMANSDIPVILKKHGFDFDRIMDDGNFPLMESKAPDLCADRVDYALRELQAWLNPKIVSRCVEGLVNHDNQIVFNNAKVAYLFATHFLQLQTLNWGSFEAVTRYNLFSNALKAAVDKNFLSEKDFYQDEKFLLKKIENIQDGEIKETLEILKNKKLKKKQVGEKIVKKFRYVDPKVLVDGKLVRLGKENVKFVNYLAKHKKINEQGIIV
ncbi:MAG: hypothetical protein UT64_C0051G0001 [Candidatus Falkowbacteria bacterium GW2011_GWF2_39_8]|uniref:HD/PDEase domain-containing protein n=1 Tax=Candidatus Falkowbacteria bacterium GW2011_GWF2_39_8 TaxID=1618642 RepID=A0A0G0SAI4_9BACT|nr:MAG: hypothetical protein UT64_C0051G0001 [Candidatus Falkowbacteria bacterium GW2011_GWF2_39_8]